MRGSSKKLKLCGIISYCKELPNKIYVISIYNL
ncbi:hypothetical protein Maeo_1263 [Methanococcus aeolicus Nankai-3]|uniref:Uncharacterized protein n=1 Tax=Methanococcus aeolicus (strain ATCC BAA-1280 / DSM 17508 / OCM 812 / Nankai-3) TaxID=419665 RepID=A6UWG7_META3|nr:hypothetical protein Maeo_1263 [Methanococcus aeolicus Nankai-3]